MYKANSEVLDIMDIGKRLKELRERAGYSVNKLAEWSGISQSHLRKVDMGNADITVGHLNLVCDALGITLKEFFDVADDKHDEISAAVSKLTPKQRKLLLAFLESLDR